MPIYDNDGTTNYEIGSIYDFDGTANHQIGKVYDNNGTASSLIYSGEKILLSHEAGNVGGFTWTYNITAGGGCNFKDNGTGWVMWAITDYGYSSTTVTATIQNDGGFTSLRVKGNLLQSATGTRQSSYFRLWCSTTGFEEFYYTSNANFDETINISGYGSVNLELLASAAWDYAKTVQLSNMEIWLE